VAGSSIHATGVDLSTLTTQDLSSDYHTYWVNWAPNQITTGIDDTTLTTFTPDDLPPGAAWTFNHRSMYVILNVAVGSPFGQPDATTQLPAQMDVGWLSYTPLTTSV
jgi:beta-glucanase (GH16 family)